VPSSWKAAGKLILLSVNVAVGKAKDDQRMNVVH